MDILRIITAGNVDDGKSTLIGRLLHDTGNIKVDILKSLEAQNEQGVNLAQVTDGLRSERAQGITIDVAYKYFTTVDRKYILTDAPGHFQYTKNLVTGASNVDAIIILIDAKNGITEQTKRHSLVAAFLNIPNVFVVVNKMDAVGYSKDVFEEIAKAYDIIAVKLGILQINYIPVSALYGDNVIVSSSALGWYSGFTLLAYLEKCEPYSSIEKPFRFSVQLVCSNTSVNVLMGKVASGSISVGQAIAAYPSNEAIVVEQLTVAGRNSTNARVGQSITLHVPEESHIAGGHLIYRQNEEPPLIADTIDVTLCWLENVPLLENTEYYIQLNGTRVKCTVTKLSSKYNIDTLELVKNNGTLIMNEIGKAKIYIERAIAFDRYIDNKATGRGILIDPVSHNTCGAFTID